MNPRCALVFCFLLPLLFAADIPPDQIFADAMVESWVPPHYPPRARAAKLEGSATISFSVSETGEVTDAICLEATDPQFTEPALNAVRQWRFQPAVEAGVKVPAGMEVVVPFRLADLQRAPALQPPSDPHPAKRTPPQPLSTPQPNYPAELAETKINGAVILGFDVSRDGTPTNIQVLDTTHPAFVRPALEILPHWRYEPARQGRVALTARQEAKLTYDHFALDRAALLAANGLTALARDGAPDPDAALPEPEILLTPVYPYEQLLAAEPGEAEVDFTVSPRGSTRDIAIASATKPEFGATLAAAVARWHFNPAVNEGRLVESRLRARHVFSSTAAVHAGSARVAPLLARKSIGSAKGLDRQLTPRWRTAPVYPESLAETGETGTALLEAVIDREGRIQAPHVVKASREEFGWAALAAIDCWVFDPPERDGEPVDVRVQVPFTFQPPAS